MGRALSVTWSDDLLTGNFEIDNQHKTFFVKALRLVVACDLGQGSEAEIQRALAFMREYAEQHFSEEERVMDAAGFPYATTHKEAHRAFLAELAMNERAYATATDKASAAFAIAEMAAAWLAHHIKIIDGLLVQFLRDHG